jgi:hypothetical protein
MKTNSLLGDIAYNTATGSLAITTGANTIRGSYDSSVYVSNGSNTVHSKIVTEEIMEKRLKNIEKRLAILVPDPLKLEKYEALKKAYDHYKMLEILLEENE